MTSPRSFFRICVLACALLPGLSAVAAQTPKKLLVVTVTTGFRHSSIPTAEKVLTELAERSGKFTLEFVRQPEGMPPTPRAPRAKGVSTEAHQEALRKFEQQEEAYKSTWMPRVEAALEKLSPANLRNYDGVIFASTTGDLPLPDKQGFLDWIASGKAFIGMHAATDTFHNFPPFIAMIGGEFKTHGAQVAVDCINQDPQHPACKGLPARWTVFDEIYQFKNFERSKVHGLLTLDKHPDNHTPGDYPVAWTRNFGQGRVFYTSLGHREDVWDPDYSDANGRRNSPDVAKRYQEHVTGGILWALGLVK